MASVSVKQEDSSIFHLTVGTEVSAKYRGAFCEAQIKSIKKNVTYKVISKKTGKSFHMSEENVRGDLKIGSTVEALFPDQTSWQECIVQSAKDKSSYTVVFDDGDERTLTRGSLCLKGDRHFAKSETLDNLPLTDPENFGTPVLAKKKNRRRRPADDEYDDDSEGHKTPDRENFKMRENTLAESTETYTSSEDEEDDDEKRAKWLADPLMGKVVIVEPHDKRKHWFPGLVVNPLCFESRQKLQDGQLVVRSFKNGKFVRIHRSCVKEMSPATIPARLDPTWKSTVEDAQNWKLSRVVPNQWKIDISNILDNDSEEENDESSEDDVKKSKKKVNDKKLDVLSDASHTTQKEKSNHDFLEELYKFMEDRGSPINKTPVLGYKDLDLFLLYKLVQKRQGSFAITAIKEWKQIYLDLGIPKPNPAAGYNVKTAYQKYLGAFEEYCISWKHILLSPAKGHTTATNKERKKTKQLVKETITKQPSDCKKIKDKDTAKGKTTENYAEGKTRSGRNSPVISIVPSPRPRRRISESSSASDVTNPTNKPDKNKIGKVAGSKRTDSKRSSIGIESEPDESTLDDTMPRKGAVRKRRTPKGIADGGASKRMRRNSTSSVSVQYSVGDKLKVKYGQGPTFKLYDAKVLRVKSPESPGGHNEYFVHYAGWNARHDEWIRPTFIVGLANDKFMASAVAGIGKFSSKRPKTPVNSQSMSNAKDDLSPSPGALNDDSNKFASIEAEMPDVEDDLPEFQVKKPRVSSLFKKNLGDDFRKSGLEVGRRFSAFVVGEEKFSTFEPPHLVPLQKVKEAALLHNEKREKRLASFKVKEQQKSDTNRRIKAEAASVSNPDKDIKQEFGKDHREQDEERSTSPSEGSMSVSETSEDNSNTSDFSIQIRRTSARHSKSPICYTEGGYFQGSKRKRGSGISDKSRSPTPTDNMKESKPDVPEVERATITELKVHISPMPAVGAVKTERENYPEETMHNTPGDERLKTENITDSSNSLDEAVPSPKKANEEQVHTSNACSVEDANTSVMVETISHSDETDEGSEQKECPSPHATEEAPIQPATCIPEDSPSDEEVKEEGNMLDELTAEKRSEERIKSLSEDSTKVEREMPTVESICETSSPAVSTHVPSSAAETPMDSEDNNLQGDSNPNSGRDEDVVDVPEPFPSPPLSSNPQTPPSSSKVLIENTPPTTPEQSPNYTSEDQDMDSGKHSPNIDSDVVDLGDGHKDSGGSASSSGCEQPSASDNPHAETTGRDHAGAKKRSNSSSGKKKMERPDRANNKRQGSLPSNYNNDSESEEENDTTRRKRRRSSSKYKPRKKKAKARPEPPSAPAPLPREELDGMPQDERIALLQARMAEMRKIYHQLKQEVANIDRKKKRAKRREREAAEAHSLACKGGLNSPTLSKAIAIKGDAAAASTVETDSVGKGKDDHEGHR